MVQSHMSGGIPGTKHWFKLRRRPSYSTIKDIRGHLVKRSFAFQQSSAHQRLLDLDSRAQRGLMSYHKRSIAELRKFCADRMLQDGAGLSKADLVSVLEHADEQSRFPRFLELPPELRVLVYEFSFDVMDDDVHKDFRKHSRALWLEPPPVATVCKLLRQESIPVFYSTTRLPIDLPADAFRFFWDDSPSRLFVKAPRSLLNLIKTIIFEVTCTRRIGSSLRCDFCTWEIELPTARTPYQIRCLPAKYKPYIRQARLAEVIIKEIEQRLREMMDKMVAQQRGVGVKLQLSDFQLFQTAFKHPTESMRRLLVDGP